MRRRVFQRAFLSARLLSLVTAVVLLAVLAAPLGAAAVPIPTERITLVYPSFDGSKMDGLALEGVATVTAGAAQITPATDYSAGGMFTKQKVHLGANGSFSTHFAFRMSGGADGMCFVVRPAGGPTSGATGGYLGYDGTPGTALAVEFDTHQNDWDPNDNHITVDPDGDVERVDPLITYTPAFDLNDGATRYVWIDYTSEHALYVKISTVDVRPVSDIISVAGFRVLPGDAAEGDVYVGFTAGTGGLSQSHELLAWQFDSGEYRTPPYFDLNAVIYTMGPARITAAAAPPSIAGGAQSAVTFTATDIDGAPFAGESIAVSAPDGGTLSADTLTTDAAGSATVTFTAPIGGSRPYTVRGVSSVGLVTTATVAVGYAAPVVYVGAGATTAYKDVPTYIAPDLTITDAYATPLYAARVRILDPEYGAEMLLGATSATGTVLEISGEKSLAEYESLLADVMYVGSPSSTLRRAEFSVFDGIGWSVPAVKQLRVSSVPPLPTRVISTMRASSDASGAQGMDDEERERGSRSVNISASGRYAVFYTGNSLVASDTNGERPYGQDWYLKDIRTGAVSLVSIGVGGQPSTSSHEGTGERASVSSDGRFVAFSDPSSNLIGGLEMGALGALRVDPGGDTNDTNDVFYRDMRYGTTTRLSIDESGAEVSAPSYSPEMSADGRFVVFRSGASLVASDTNDESDIYVRDVLAGTIDLVSVDASGGPADAGSYDPDVSDDGRYVAFQSDATDLDARDDNEGSDIFVRDTLTGVTTRVSVTSGGSQLEGSCWSPSISADGRKVAFSIGMGGPRATNLSPSTLTYVRDRKARTTRCVSIDAAGAVADGFEPDISDDGRYVVFQAFSALAPGDTNSALDVWVRDTLRGATTIVSLASSRTCSDGYSYMPSISADGLRIAYGSDATDLVSGDTNRASDVFVARLSAPPLPASGTSVGRPITKWIVRRDAKTLVYGYLSTWHKRGTYPVVLRCYHLEDGKWVLRKTARLKATSITRSKRTKYAGYVRLPRKGYWRLTATHTNPGYATDVSGARYLWVK